MNNYFVRYSYEYTRIKDGAFVTELFTESTIIVLEHKPSDIYTIQLAVFRQELDNLDYPPSETEIEILGVNLL